MDDWCCERNGVGCDCGWNTHSCDVCQCSDPAECEGCEHNMDRILSEVFVLVDRKMPTREYVHSHNEELRAHIKKTWKHSGTQFYEDHISPCGGYRSFVSDTGALEITKYTKTYSRFTTTVGRWGCKTGRWVSYTN